MNILWCKFPHKLTTCPSQRQSFGIQRFLSHRKPEQTVSSDGGSIKWTRFFEYNLIMSNWDLLFVLYVMSELYLASWHAYKRHVFACGQRIHRDYWNRWIDCMTNNPVARGWTRPRRNCTVALFLQKINGVTANGWVERQLVQTNAQVSSFKLPKHNDLHGGISPCLPHFGTNNVQRNSDANS